MNIVTADFIVEDVYLQSMNGGIQKKFTSLATNATIFRWRFGDTKKNPIIEVYENPYYYTYKEKGTYTVEHQTCYPCNLTLTCSNWCSKSITVGEAKPNVIPALVTAGLFFLIIPKKGCDDYGNKKDCQKHDCHWITEEKKCVKKCKKGTTLERVKLNKRHYKYGCKPEIKKIKK